MKKAMISQGKAKTDALCTHVLSTLLHYVIILEHKWCPVELGLTTPEDPEQCYMQCLNPADPTYEGRAVTFKYRRMRRR